jgi:hypothetical protein
MPADTEQLIAWRSQRPLRFRAARAYWVTLRILGGYLWDEIAPTVRPLAH